MRMVRTLLVFLASMLALSSSVASQEESLSVAAARKLFGDYLVIPGERVGNVRLGEVRKDEFTLQYGLTRLYGFSASKPSTWNWPRQNIGESADGHDQPYIFYFCRSNNRLFAAAAFQAGSWYPNYQIFWLFLRRLRTPEGVTGAHGVDPNSRQWAPFYGDPLIVLHDLSQDRRPFYIFANGLFVANGREQLGYFGAYNTGICDEQPVKGAYVPFIGRLESRLLFSKSGDAMAETIGDNIQERVFKANEPLYIGLELSFGSPPKPTPITVLRKFIPPQGEVMEETRHYLIEPGKTSRLVVYLLSSQQRVSYGDWRVEIYVNGVLLGQGSFLNSP